MKNLPLLTIFSIMVSLLSSCASSRNTSAEARPKKSKITGVRPNVKTPSIGVINASGDALTPGINSANRNGAGSEENATSIANNAITKANFAVRRPQLKLDTIAGQDFINRISVIDNREMKMSQLALEKSASQKVKDYAAMTIKSHQELQNDLNKLSADAAVKGAELIITSLQFANASAGGVKPSAGESKANFDIGYIQTTIEDYQALIRLLEAGNRSKDAGITAFSAKYLPVLRQHLSAAQDLTRK
jgi:predicted outer membrane protein